MKTIFELENVEQQIESVKQIKLVQGKLLLEIRPVHNGVEITVRNVRDHNITANYLIWES